MRQTPITQWEEALSPYEKIGPVQWEEIVRKLNSDLDEDEIESELDTEDEVANAQDSFEIDAEDFKLGCLSIEFPNSTHGDGCSAHVFRLPGGTTVITRSATFEMEEPDTAVYRGDNFDSMTGIAYDLIDTGMDLGEVQDLDDDPEYDSDSDTIYDGRNELLEAWDRALKKEQSKHP